MWKSLKKKIDALKRGSPGKRFKAHYHARLRSGDKPAALSRVLNFVVAAVCFVLGIVFSFMPIVPGFVFFFAGAFLLAAESFRAAQFLDWVEVSLRALWERIRGRHRRTQPRSHHPRRIPRPAK